MRKHTDTIVTSAFLVLCVLGSLFYALGIGSFGINWVPLGGGVWLLATVALLGFLLLEKRSLAAVCAGAICLGQVWILYCWIVILGRPVLLPRFHVMMPWGVGVALHLLILILGILVFRRVRKIH